MINTAENSLKIGNGIFTIRDISKILNLPYHKVTFWLNNYWDGELGAEYKNVYSWTVKKSN